MPDGQGGRVWPAGRSAILRRVGWLALGPAVAAAVGAALGETCAGLRVAGLLTWAALVAADERALGPLFFHQPLVAASVTGLLLGRPLAGLTMGILLQAIWPGLLPMGGSRQPAVGPAALVGAAWLSLLSPHESIALPFALGLAITAAAAGDRGEVWLRRRNERRERQVYATVTSGAHVPAGTLAAVGVLEAGLLGPLVLLLWVAVPAAAIQILIAGGGELVSPFLPANVLGGDSSVLPGVTGAGGPPLATGWDLTWAMTRASLWEAGWAAPAAVFFALGGVAGGRARELPGDLRRLRAAAASKTDRSTVEDRSTVMDRSTAADRSTVVDRSSAVGRSSAAESSSPAGPVPRVAPSSTQASPPVPRPTLRQWLAWLLVQASFNVAFLQRTGFLGLVRAIPAGRLGPARALRESTAVEVARGGPYNTQPILAAALAGGLERILVAAGREAPPRPPMRLLGVGGSVLAQWGDRTIWGGARPLVSLLSLAALAAGPCAGLAVFATASLGLHLGGRWAFYRWGWRRGWEAALGGRSAAWERLPALLGLAIPAAAVAATLALSAGQGPGGGPTANGGDTSFPLGVVWFILGAPVGLLVGRRAFLWGWICALALGAALLLGG